SNTQTKFHVLPRQDKQLSISNARIKLDRCVFNVQKCKKLTDQLSKYRKKWNESAGRYEEMPYHNTACFVGETLIETSQGMKRIDEMKIGDCVLTPNGFKKVLNVFSYDCDCLIEVC